MKNKKDVIHKNETYCFGINQSVPQWFKVQRTVIKSRILVGGSGVYNHCPVPCLYSKPVILRYIWFGFRYSVRRYHDTGRSGKQVAAIVFVTMASTVVNIVVAIVFLNGLALRALSVYNGGGLNEIQGPSGHFLLFIVAIVNVFIILGVCIYNIVILSLPSQPGTNVYGEWIPFGAKAVRD